MYKFYIPVLTSNEVPGDRSTHTSIPSTIDGSHSELIYHTSVGAILCEVKLCGVDKIGVERIATHSDVNTVLNVNVNSSYIQTRWSIPSEANNFTQIFRPEVTDSLK